jgi:UDP-2-acetamido-2-deoxy-ribo-hexuluronate aminotransferase
VDLLIDVNVAIDICTQRKPHAETSALAIDMAASNEVRLWLYCGSTQTLEYNLYKHLSRENLAAGKPQTNKTVLAKARRLLAEFVRDKQWLAALANEGPVFDAPDPEDEQLLRALDRFPQGSIKLLTRDDHLLATHPEKTISPEAYLRLDLIKKPIEFIDLKAQQDKTRPQLENNIHRVLHHGQYIMGPEVQELEKRLADYVGVEHCISCSSGTDSLLIAMMALGIGPGDEVITTPFSFIAAAEMIVLLGAKPVFVDIDPDTYNIDANLIESAITPRTRALIPVSLYGQPADYDEINAIAAKHNLPVIEDGAQSFGATYKGRKSCGLTTIGSTSFFPSKPLGCYGDGGALFTNDDYLAKTMREIRIHGQEGRYCHSRVGLNGRLDALQAAVLLAKLVHFDDEIQDRRRTVGRYADLFRQNPACSGVKMPRVLSGCTHVYAQYTIEVDMRDAIQAELKLNNIPTVLHYPAGLHRQPVLAARGFCSDELPVTDIAVERVISLPVYPCLSELTLNDMVACMARVLGNR